jgi:lysophospholipase L1-like esterase
MPPIALRPENSLENPLTKSRSLELARILIVHSKPILIAAWILLGFTATVNASDVPSAASTETPKVSSRWDTAFAAFADDDALHPHPAGGVLFVGSSTIRLWNDLEAQFKDAPVVIKRGFGGSQLSDCVKHLNRLVVRYRPRTVLVYAGDNDLAAGTAPAEVFHRFTAFVDGVHRELPDTGIFYISIKPSPSRIALLPQIRETNRLIRDYADAEGKVDFIDVYTPMLDASGKPRPELFRADALHLNTDGYALWKRVIAPHVH